MNEQGYEYCTAFFATLAGVGVDYVVEVPQGAWPTSCYPDYPFDGDELLDYVEACASGEFDSYLDRFLASLPKGQEEF